VATLVRRKIVRQPSGVYTITIPKSIIEANKLQESEFEIFIKDDEIILKLISNKKD